jgi:hypothetical protein
MPTYDYACTSDYCFNIQEEEVSISKFKDHHPVCEVCGSLCDYHFTPSVVQFALKDGPSGSWPSKGNHFKNYRNQKAQEMERRQKERYGHINRDAIPNYQGQVTENWREAQDLAMKDKERQEKVGTDSLAVASTYVPKIEAEKTKKSA